MMPIFEIIALWFAIGSVFALSETLNSDKSDILPIWTVGWLLWPLMLNSPFELYHNIKQKRIQNSPFVKTKKLIEEGVLIAEGIPDPHYSLASIIATKIVRHPELIKPRERSNPMSYQWYDWELGKTSISIIEYGSSDSWGLSFVRVDGESFKFTGEAEKVLDKAINDAMLILEKRKENEKLAKERQKALDAIEVVMDLPKPPKKKVNGRVPGCEFSCCNPDAKLLEAYRECDCDEGCGACRIN